MISLFLTEDHASKSPPLITCFLTYMDAIPETMDSYQQEAINMSAFAKSKSKIGYFSDIF